MKCLLQARILLVSFYVLTESNDMEGHQGEGDHNKAAMETTDRGMFDFTKKKDEEQDNEKKEEKPTLMGKLHRSNSSSSSVSFSRQSQLVHIYKSLNI